MDNGISTQAFVGTLRESNSIAGRAYVHTGMGSAKVFTEDWVLEQMGWKYNHHHINHETPTRSCQTRSNTP
jgi:hypothetical protein